MAFEELAKKVVETATEDYENSLKTVMELWKSKKKLDVCAFKVKDSIEREFKRKGSIFWMTTDIEPDEFVLKIWNKLGYTKTLDDELLIIFNDKKAYFSIEGRYKRYVKTIMDKYKQGLVDIAAYRNYIDIRNKFPGETFKTIDLKLGFTKREQIEIQKMFTKQVKLEYEDSLKKIMNSYGKGRLYMRAYRFIKLNGPYISASDRLEMEEKVCFTDEIRNWCDDKLKEENEKLTKDRKEKRKGAK